MPDTSEPTFDQEYFAQAYGPYYELRNPPRKIQSFLRQVTRLCPHGNLLDIGCAYGLFLHAALAHYAAHGCDLAYEALLSARARLPQDVLLVCASATDLPFDDQYDVVTAFDVLEHVADLDRALAEIRRVLHPGGLLALTVPVYDGPLGPLVNAMDHDRTHQHRQGRSFWLKKLTESGFCLREYTGVLRYFLARRFYLNLLSRPLRWAAPAILLLAEKEEAR